ncbi:M48 family metalloprotease [Actinoplanes sp. NPDC051411]|uniref:M48 family metalloprotease n=1 Tax=Actinoplanes sp. NPDC051411 TaxID=3155522 RepID=UPI00341E5EBF
MTLLVYLPLLLPVVVSLVARRAADRVPPALAVRGLVAAALAAAALSAWSLILLSLTLFDDLPPWRALGGRPGLHLPQPVPDAVAALALGALGWAVVRLGRDLRHRADTVRRLRQAGPAHEGLVVADWDSPLAVAVPGHPGHVLVTSGMLRALGPAERRAVFAHERAHLAHRHHALVAAAAAAAAVNPLLAPVRPVVTYLVERWADEDAAAALADRGLVARAVARAALAGAPAAAPALGITGGVIVRRVNALRQPPAVDGGLLLLVAALAAVAVCLMSGGDATTDFVEVFRAWPR